MAAITIRGVSGELRRAYRVVATLGRWELVSRHRCEADVVTRDAFEWDQDGPLALRLHVGPKTWTYPDVVLLRRESPLIVKLPHAPEVR